jgi:hypothetical protein
MDLDTLLQHFNQSEQPLKCLNIHINIGDALNLGQKRLRQDNIDFMVHT